MKRFNFIFLVLAVVLISTGIWFFAVQNTFKVTDLLQGGILLIIALFGLFFGYKRLGSGRRGEPAEDELSKSILQKSAALSYYISLYMWVFMIWLADRVDLDTDQILGSGIVAMAVIFALSWLFVRFKGLRNG